MATHPSLADALLAFLLTYLGLKAVKLIKNLIDKFIQYVVQKLKRRHSGL